MKQSETRVQYGIENFWEFLCNQRRRSNGKLFRYLWNRFQWSYFPKLRIVPKFPLNIDIEASSACNIKCDHCFRQYMTVGENALMPMDMYKKIVDECGENKLYTLKFSMRGEPTLHPQLSEMIAYAKQKKIPEVWVNTHGGNLTEKLCEDMIKAGVDWITVSFDGLGKMYESIRKPLKYEENLARLKMLRSVRDRLKANTFLNVQTLWSAMKDNPGEYIKIMKAIVDRVAYNADMNFKEITLVPDDEFVCPRLWHRLAITSTGDVLKCPSDFLQEEVLGNVRTQSLKNIWECEQEFERQKHMHLRKKESCVCQKCHHGSKRVKRQVRVGEDVSTDFNYEFKKDFTGVGLNRK